MFGTDSVLTRWNDYSFSCKGLWNLQNLYDTLIEEGVVIRISAHHVPNASDVHKLMTSLHGEDSSTEKRILLDLSTNTKNEVFESNIMVWISLSFNYMWL